MNNPNKPKSVFDQLSEGTIPETDVSTPVAAPVAVPQTAGLDNTLLAQFVALLLAKEGRLAAEAQADVDRRKAIQKQRDRNSKDQDSKFLLKQARCKHLKGGKRGPKTQNKDFAVYQHRFITFVEYIRCRICGMRWFPEDTIDYLKRNGKRISNHTKIGWREAVAMTDASTDTASASEALPNISPTAAGNYRDASGLPVTPRFVDEEGKEVTNVQL
jgi:hypothetical protein